MSSVDNLVKKLNPELKPIANKLRELINNTLPDSEEFVRWNNPMWVVKGKNAISMMCYKTHINLEFFNGAFLHSKLLEGTGKGLRHIKVKDVADIKKKEKEIIKVIKESAAKI